MVCLQETKLAPNSRLAVKGYAAHRQDLPVTSVAHGGVAALVHHSVPHSRLTLRTSLQAVAVRVLLGVTALSICSLYLPPAEAFDCHEIESLLAQLPTPLLVLGDMNAHHSLWGCTRCCQRGKQLEKMLQRSSLCLLNTGCATHVSLPQGTLSAIDLSICSPTLPTKLSWEVESTPLGSDHFPI